MKETYFLLQTYEIFLKIMYLKLLQEYWTYEWDLWNRLIEVKQYNTPDNGECVDVSYEYDALNHRISRRQIDIDKNEEIESSVPLPSINYKERFLQGGETNQMKAKTKKYLRNLGIAYLFAILGLTFKFCRNDKINDFYTLTNETLTSGDVEIYDEDLNIVGNLKYENSTDKFLLSIKGEKFSWEPEYLEINGNVETIETKCKWK